MPPPRMSQKPGTDRPGCVNGEDNLAFPEALNSFARAWTEEACDVKP